MPLQPSLMNRIIIGKSLGFVVGLLAFICLPLLYVESTELLRWGILFWYITFGAIIAVFGVFTWHPILRLPLPWWLRSPILGAWLNFVLMFFTYDEIQAILQQGFGASGMWASPMWVVAEGALIGLMIGAVATHFGGEGKHTLDEQPG